MEKLLDVEWGRLLIPSISPLEILVRGTAVYLGLFTLLRVILRRETGAIGMGDLLVIVLLADAAQNAMSGNYSAITDGLLLVTVIIGWDYALQWVAFHVAALRPLIQPPPLPLIKDGRALPRNMHRELVTLDELKSQLRLEGVEDISEVKLAYLESDGRISVITKSEGKTKAPPKRVE